VSAVAGGRRIGRLQARLNQALYDEFVRTTGATERRDFATWVRELRNVARAGLRDPRVWDGLSGREQVLLMLGRLRASPPAEWPTIDLGGA
jgi:hypothetical protein